MARPSRLQRLRSVSWRWLWAAPLLVALLWSAVAWARPGGGGSFSGGGGGGGGGGGDDSFILDLIFLVLELLIDYPQIGLPLIGVIIVAWIVWRAWQSDNGKIILGVGVAAGIVALIVFWPPIGLGVAGAAVVLVGVAAIGGFLRKKPPEWSTAVEQAPTSASTRVRSPRRQLETLQRADPDFSIVVLEDFLDALYVEVQHARAGGLERLQPYLKPEARVALAGDLAAVKDVIVGAMHIQTFKREQHRARLEVEFETNLTEVGRDQVERSYYLRDRWTLSRRAEAASRAPEKARIFQCPNCGAALEGIAGGVCSYCKQQVDTGDHDWIVEGVQSLARESRGPILTEQAAEQGTDLPTVLDADLDRARAGLAEKDPAFTQTALAQRIHLIFATMQVAWSTREWLKARPYLSDRLFQAQLYWIDAYKRAKLRNLNEQTVITKSQLVRVTSDKFFDGVTVRIYAQGLDYVVDDDGKLICGSKSQPRKYSEYWTLIRGATVRGAPRAEPNCPSCGAPLDVNMAGNCAHCKARVTLGEFDWVLSRIEQDEVYGG